MKIRREARFAAQPTVPADRPMEAASIAHDGRSGVGEQTVAPGKLEADNGKEEVEDGEVEE